MAWFRYSAYFLFLLCLFTPKHPYIRIVAADQQGALMAFYADAGGTNWIAQIGWTNTPTSVCSWDGVQCGTGPDAANVISVSLPNNRLVGSLSSELSQLSALQYLDLSRNQLSGTIPATLTICTALVYLNLYSNQLSGSLPATFPLINELRLASNQFSGTIPPGLLSTPTNLTIIDLSFNGLSGVIPPITSAATAIYLSYNSLTSDLGNLNANFMASLYKLYVNNNLLSGTIGANTFLFMHKLADLSLASNMLSGDLPNLAPKLTKVELQSNSFTGAIPSNWMAALTEGLRYVDISNNHISDLTSRFTEMTDLQTLVANSIGLTQTLPAMPTGLVDVSFRGNGFSGEVPLQWTDLVSLTRLVLSQNLFTTLITSLSRLGVLYLDLSFNTLVAVPQLFSSMRIRTLLLNNAQISGSLPVSYQTVTSLQHLDLSSNSLSGSLPSEWSLLVNMEALVLTSNTLSGIIPVNYAAWVNLRRLELGSNLISGSVPSLGSWTRLQSLDLSLNSMTGAIPNNMSLLVNLTSLKLTANTFSGAILSNLNAMTKLAALELGTNSFTGTIPAAFSLMTDLSSLSLGSNSFSGVLNDQFVWSKLVTFDLGRNAFSGSIPLAFTLCNKVTLFDIGRNSFSGELSAGLSVMKLLSFVVSNNNLTGSFPTQFTTWTNLVRLDVANNMLSGSLVDGMAVQTALTYLSIGNNMFTGSISTALGALVRLTYLDLSDNLLTDTLVNIGALTLLQTLDVSNNSLSGALPSAALLPLTALRTFDVSSNMFSGSLSTVNALTQWALVTYLNAANNQFSGNVPAFGTQTNLKELRLSNNLLQGTLAATMFNTALSSLSIDGNALFGTPTALLSLVGTQRINIANNAFNGELPHLSSLTRLSYLSVEGNQFSGTINNLFLFSDGNQIRTLLMGRNYFSGTFPNGFIFFNNLQQLDLCGNQFSGPLNSGYALAASLTLTSVCYRNNSWSGVECATASCSYCPLGTASSVVYPALAPSSCPQCVAGTFTSSVGRTVCTPCDIALYSDVVGATTASTCLPCVRGGYCDTAGLVQPKLCAAGTWSNVTNATSISTCKQCPAGTYNTVVGAANLCAAGTWSNVTNATSISTCKQCPAGTYNTVVGAANLTMCVLCPLGSYSGTLGASSSGACISCPANSFSVTVGATSSQACIQCPVGRWGNITLGSVESACVDCVPGTFNPNAASINISSCQQCPVGTWSNVSAATAFSTCRNCSYGFTTNSSGANTEAECHPGVSLSALLDIYSTMGGGSWTVNWDTTLSYSAWNGVYLAGTVVTRLELPLNQMSGSVPTSVSGLRALVSLNLYGNSVTGPLPDSLSALSMLTRLDLASNQLSGSIPNSITSIGTLQLLSLSQNMFSGALPMGALWTALASYDVQLNSLTGSIPTVIGVMTALTALSLSNNAISGIIPTDVQLLTNLHAMALMNNALSGSLPLAANSPIQTLLVSGNSLSSTLPAALGSAANLRWLDVTGNALTGSLPVGITALSNLQQLLLSGNQLSGSLPPSLTAMASLSVWNVSYNSLVGSVPPSYIGSVYTVDISHNALTGITCTGSSCAYCVAGEFSTTQNLPCTPCPAGTYSSTTGASACSGQCVIGTWSNVIGASNDTICYQCPAGTYGTSAGADSVSDCQQCVQGYYSAVPAANSATTCLECPAGTWSNAFAASTLSACLPCVNGTYSSALAATSPTSCALCVPGTWSNTTAATSVSVCMNCPAGTYSSVFGAGNSSMCIGCPRGSWSDVVRATSPSVCTGCLAGRYNAQTGGSSLAACTLCSAGTWSDTLAATSASACQQCPPGSASVLEGASTFASCLQCPAGTWANSTSALSGSEDCVSCVKGTYSAAVGATNITTCLSCAAGYYSNTTAATTRNACLPCANGTWSSTTAASSAFFCTPCGAGFWGNSSAASTAAACIACAPGRYNAVPVAANLSMCLPCPAGTWSNTSAAGDVAQCVPCAAGYWSNAVGASSISTCTACGGGTYATVIGATSVTSCLSCAAGTWSNATSATTISVCRQCEAGTFSTTVGAASIITCTLCARGTYSGATGASSSTTCQSCAAGTWSDVLQATSSATCVPCDAGTYNTQTGSSSVAACLPCAAGTYSGASSRTAASDCVKCVAGTWSSVLNATSSAACQQCVAGTWSTTVGASAESQCIQCLVGTFSGTAGADSISTCVACAAGYFSTVLGATDISSCQQCAAGTWSNVTAMSSASLCVSCLAGTYSNATAATSIDSCVPCAAGSYSGVVAATSASTCQKCAAGRYNPFTGSSSVAACTSCIAGTYSPTVGASSNSTCIACLAGRWSALTAATSSTACISCASGTWSGITGASAFAACTQCVAGTYSQFSAATSINTCNACPQATWSSVVGAAFDTCQACAVGTWSAATAASSITTCQNCPGGSFSNTTLATGPAICHACDPGHFSFPGSTNCLSCDFGYWTGAPLSPSCTQCHGGAMTLKTGSTTALDCIVVTDVYPTEAPNNALALVTVTGVSLSDGTDITSVTVGNASCAIVFQSVNEVVVRLPLILHAGVYDVTTASPSQGTYFKSLSFTVRPVFQVQLSQLVLTETTSVTLNFTLSAIPPAPVTLPVALGSFLLNASALQVTFNSSNWDQPQFVTVFYTLDHIVRDDAMARIDIGPTVLHGQSAWLFANFTASFDVELVNVDYAGLIVTPGRGILPNVTGIFIRKSQFGTLFIELSAIPAADVVITSVCDPTRIVCVNDTIVFAPEEWNTQKMVMITYPFTPLVDPLEWGYAIFSFISADPLFGTLPDVQVPILMIDAFADDLIQMSPVLGSVSESGQSTLLFMVVTRLVQPGTFIDVNITVANPLLARTEPDLMQLGPDSYSIGPIPVFVYAVHNYIVTGNVSVNITTLAVYVTTRISLFQPVHVYDIDIAGLDLAAPSLLVVNETGLRDSFALRLTSRPLATVLFPVTYNATVVSLSPAVITILPASWNDSHVVVATGLRDTINVDRAFNLTAVATSADRNYQGRAFRISAVNLDVVWPSLTRLEPLTIPPTRPNVTLHGARFLPNITATIDWGYGVVNMTWQNYTRLTYIAEYLTKGYHNVTLANPDGGFLEAVDAAFYSDDCPFEGFIGQGANCTTCPGGAHCPGGNRIWPLPGYWTEGEFAGYVIACPLPAVRCQGGRGSPCADGYLGVLCAQCASGYYYQQDGYCLLCEQSSTISALFVLQFLFLVFFVFSLLLMNSNGFENVQFVLYSFRILWVVSVDQGYGLPSIFRSSFSVLSLFVGDVKFTHPGCTALDSYLSLFGANVGIAIGAFIPVPIVLYRRYRIRVRKLIARARKSDPQDAINASWNEFVARFVYGLVGMLLFNYEVLFSRGLEAIYCFRAGASVLLFNDTRQACFVGGHIPVFVIGAIIVLFFGAVFPFGVIFLVYKHRFVHHQHGVRAKMSTLIAVSASEEFKTGWPALYGVGCLLIVDLPLIAVNVFGSSNSILYLFGCKIVVMTANIIFVCILKPFRQWYKNIGQVGISITGIFVAIAAVCAQLDAVGPAAVFAYMAVGGLYAFCGSAIVLFFYYQVLWRCFPQAMERLAGRANHNIQVLSRSLSMFVTRKTRRKVAKRLRRQREEQSDTATLSVVPSSPTLSATLSTDSMNAQRSAWSTNDTTDVDTDSEAPDAFMVGRRPRAMSTFSAVMRNFANDAHRDGKQGHLHSVNSDDSMEPMTRQQRAGSTWSATMRDFTGASVGKQSMPTMKQHHHSESDDSEDAVPMDEDSDGGAPFVRERSNSTFSGVMRNFGRKSAAAVGQLRLATREDSDGSDSTVNDDELAQRFGVNVDGPPVVATRKRSDSTFSSYVRSYSGIQSNDSLEIPLMPGNRSPSPRRRVSIAAEVMQLPNSIDDDISAPAATAQPDLTRTPSRSSMKIPPSPVRRSSLRTQMLRKASVGNISLLPTSDDADRSSPVSVATEESSDEISASESTIGVRLFSRNDARERGIFRPVALVLPPASLPDLVPMAMLEDDLDNSVKAQSLSLTDLDSDSAQSPSPATDSGSSAYEGMLFNVASSCVSAYKPLPEGVVTASAISMSTLSSPLEAVALFPEETMSFFTSASAYLPAYSSTAPASVVSPVTTPREVASQVELEPTLLNEGTFAAERTTHFNIPSIEFLPASPLQEQASYAHSLPMPLFSLTVPGEFLPYYDGQPADLHSSNDDCQSLDTRDMVRSLVDELVSRAFEQAVWMFDEHLAGQEAGDSAGAAFTTNSRRSSQQDVADGLSLEMQLFVLAQMAGSNSSSPQRSPRSSVHSDADGDLAAQPGGDTEMLDNIASTPSPRLQPVPLLERPDSRSRVSPRSSRSGSRRVSPELPQIAPLHALAPLPQRLSPTSDQQQMPHSIVDHSSGRSSRSSSRVSEHSDAHSYATAPVSTTINDRLSPQPRMSRRRSDPSHDADLLSPFAALLESTRRHSVESRQAFFDSRIRRESISSVSSREHSPEPGAGDTVPITAVGPASRRSSTSSDQRSQDQPIVGSASTRVSPTTSRRSSTSSSAAAVSRRSSASSELAAWMKIIDPLWNDARTTPVVQRAPDSVASDDERSMLLSDSAPAPIVDTSLARRPSFLEPLAKSPSRRASRTLATLGASHSAALPTLPRNRLDTVPRAVLGSLVAPQQVEVSSAATTGVNVSPRASATHSANVSPHVSRSASPASVRTSASAVAAAPHNALQQLSRASSRHSRASDQTSRASAMSRSLSATSLTEEFVPLLPAAPQPQESPSQLSPDASLQHYEVSPVQSRRLSGSTSPVPTIHEALDAQIDDLLAQDALHTTRTRRSLTPPRHVPSDPVTETGAEVAARAMQFMTEAENVVKAATRLWAQAVVEQATDGAVERLTRTRLMQDLKHLLLLQQARAFAKTHSMACAMAMVNYSADVAISVLYDKHQAAQLASEQRLISFAAADSMATAFVAHMFANAPENAALERATQFVQERRSVCATCSSDSEDDDTVTSALHSSTQRSAEELLSAGGDLLARPPLFAQSLRALLSMPSPTVPTVPLLSRTSMAAPQRRVVFSEFNRRS
eukprot:TRINITY_DN3615_c0_g1_i5.p1 TRINITY_DN3615_c0_g1~~TRINITY_DN3615_c0_g1_i5.p1  ORF type:complete len:5028 (-),score=1048.37 TRINITY_DN3615_c0_g1_i5:200-15283(-)